MSQKKVEAYKEYKKNKAQILKREKRMRKIEYGIIIAICCVFVGWFGFSIYNSATRKSESQTETPVAVELNMDAYENYVHSLQSSFS